MIQWYLALVAYLSKNRSSYNGAMAGHDYGSVVEEFVFFIFNDCFKFANIKISTDVENKRI